MRHETMNAIFTLPFTASLNHLLEREEWARERLRPHAGRIVHFRIAPLPALRLRITAAGLVDTADDEQAALTLDIRPGLVPALMRHDEAALREIGIQGDAELAADIQFLFRNLRWDIEGDLSRVFGDVAAHRLAESGRSFMAWQREAAVRLGENLSDYLQDEARLLARRAEVERFVREVNDLRDAVERLEKRIRKREGTG